MWKTQGTMDEKNKKLEREGGEKIKEIEVAEGAKMKSVREISTYFLRARKVTGISWRIRE